MPLCGFNQEMLEALRDYTKASLKRVSEKAKKSDVSFTDAMRKSFSTF